MRRWIWLLTLLGLASQTLADGLIIIHEPVAVPQGHYPFAPLEVTYHHVNVKIDGPIATTSIDQEFYNPNPQRLEGTYLFPVPKGGQLNKFTMDIGGKQVEAELVPANKARQIYEDIVRRTRDPALLEYADRDMFKVRIFPIEPRSNKRVTLSYSQVLKSDSGLVSYVYPLNTEKFSAKPIKDVSVKIELATKHSLKSIYSPSHSVEIRRYGSNKATIGFEARDVRPDTDLQLFIAEEDADVGVKLITYKESSEDGYFLLLASPGAEMKSKQVVRKDVAFVLDTSGSMAGNKLAQAKKALQFCVENLNDGDRFEIIRFSTETEPLFEKLVEATDENRSRAQKFIQDLKPMGGTAIDEALGKALALRPENSDRPFVVIFLTDGQPTIGTTDENQIVAHVTKANGANTRVFCFGIGTDVNTHLLDKITEETRAFSQYVLPEEDIELKVSSFFTKIKEPVLTNLKLKFSGDVRVSKMYPSPLPDLFKGEQLVLLGRYSGKGQVVATIEGAVNGARKKFTDEVSFSSDADENEFIPRLWATRRIGYLLDEIRLHGESSELKDEVTELARKYGIVTPYTAYLIVEDESRRNVPVPMRSMQRFDEDRTAREGAGSGWAHFKDDKAGDVAVSGARSSHSYKSAGSMDAIAKSKEESEKSIAAATPSAPVAQEAVQRINQYTQQQRFVKGRTFFQNGNQWIDSNVQNMTKARRVQVKFNSQEYFDLIAKNQDALPWFSVGRNVQVAIGDTVYEIME
jgi:Ca-activated chloride channel family protein